MLKELKPVRQNRGEFRRLFQDEFFDLFIWYQSPQSPQEIVGFQLCYDKFHNERALTWRKRSGFTHSRIDTGDDSPEADRTPVLIPGGDFHPQWVITHFKQRSANLDPDIAALVLNKLEECQQSSPL